MKLYWEAYGAELISVNKNLVLMVLLQSCVVFSYGLLFSWSFLVVFLHGLFKWSFFSSLSF